MAITFTEKPVRPLKIRLLLSGNAGTGKTWTSLGFPSPLVANTEGERALDPVRSLFKFKDANTRSVGEINELLDQIIAGKIEGETFVLDSGSRLWKAIQEDHPTDTYQKEINKEFGAVVDKMYEKVPIHVVVTAWEKVEYYSEGSVVPGRETPVQKDEKIVKEYHADAHKTLEHTFDFHVRMAFDESTETYYGTVLKARGDKWVRGQRIDNLSYKDFLGIIGETAEAELEIETTVRERAAATVAAETVKDNGEEPQRGSDKHVMQLLGVYNKLVPEEKRLMGKVTDWLHTVKLIAPNQTLATANPKQREAIVIHLEKMIREADEAVHAVAA